MWKYFCSFLTLLIVLADYPARAQSGQRCTTPNGETARCISVYSCDVLYNAVTTTDQNVVKFLRASQCGYDKDPLVCCGTASSYTTPTPVVTTPTRVNLNNLQLLPNRKTCGYQVSENRVLGGETAALDEFPWMALLRYRNSTGFEQFSCGGTLISPRYVVTAAHCVIGAITKKIGTLITVRLGEWNTDTDPDCIGKICSDPPVDMEVEDAIPHPQYNDNSVNRYNDIALIRLKREVQYTNYIRPVCLPTDTEMAKVGDLLEVAGWGRTEVLKYSPTKQKLRIPVVPLSDCRATFRRSGVTIDNTQLCAGGERDKDSCTGDSGGPLLNTVGRDGSQHYIEGIVSFGAECGRENWPGVYTRVSQYVNWIVNNIRK